MRTPGMASSINFTTVISHRSTTISSLRCAKLTTSSSYIQSKLPFTTPSSPPSCGRLSMCNNFPSFPSPSLRTGLSLPKKNKKERIAITKTSKPKVFTPHASSGDSPLVGNVAPDFEVEAVLDQEFIKVKLSDYIGKSFVILFFYPLDFTFVCPTEITAFSDRYSEFQDLNTTIIGISTDSIFSHLAWLQTDRKLGGLGDLRYPLASDLTKSISKQYNVLVRDQGVALRGLYIIDMDGIIQYSTTNNLSCGRSVDETLRILQAIQYVQNNPEHVCPVEWKPGEKSIPSSPQLSKDYFGNVDGISKMPF